MATITTKDGTQIYYKELGRRAADCLQPWMAADRGRVGRPDALSGVTRLSLHRSRSAWPRTIEPAVERQRDGHVCGRSPRAGRGARSSRGDSRRSLHRGRRGGALSRSSRHWPCGQGRSHWRRATADAEDRRESGRLPIEAFDAIRTGVLADRSQFFIDLTMPFYGFNRPGAKVPQGIGDSFWMQGMLAGHKSALDCIKAFSETDFTEDLKKRAVHGMCTITKDQVNADLLAFIKS